MRRFLPLLLDTLEFQATDAGEQVLKALKRIEHKHTLEPDDVAMQIVSRSWRRLAEPEPGKVNRHAHTFYALEALRDSLYRRDVFIRRSNRWPVTVRTSARVAGRRHPRCLPRRIAEPRSSPTVWPPSPRHSDARRFKRARVSDRT